MAKPVRAAIQSRSATPEMIDRPSISTLPIMPLRCSCSIRKKEMSVFIDWVGASRARAEDLPQPTTTHSIQKAEGRISRRMEPVLRILSWTCLRLKAWPAMVSGIWSGRRAEMATHAAASVPT